MSGDKFTSEMLLKWSMVAIIMIFCIAATWMNLWGRKDKKKDHHED